MADRESIAGETGCVEWRHAVGAATALSLSEALPRLITGAALLLRVAQVDKSPDAQAAARWLAALGPVAAIGMAVSAPSRGRR